MPPQELRLADDLPGGSAAFRLITPAHADHDHVRDLERENRELKLTIRRLRQLAYVDGLTGLANRRHFESALHTEIRRASRTREPLALAICDVDFFKRVNDELGHSAGDDVLRVLGQILDQQCRRGGDLAARYGGEEFALLMPGVDSAEIVAVAERVREIVAGTPIPCGHPAHSARVTVSLGATAFASNVPCLPADLIQAADTALYRAKRAGRNGVRYEAIVSAGGGNVRRDVAWR